MNELTDEQISDTLSALKVDWWDVPQDATEAFARAIIAADCAQRQAGQEPAGVVQGFTADGDAIVDHDCESGGALKAGDCLYAAPPAAWDEPAITALAVSMSVAVAKNASTAPQLCFPDIYLGLKEALMPVTQTEPS